jgi:hypothetical protein
MLFLIMSSGERCTRTPVFVVLSASRNAELGKGSKHAPFSRNGLHPAGRPSVGPAGGGGGGIMCIGCDEVEPLQATSVEAIRARRRKPGRIPQGRREAGEASRAHERYSNSFSM